MSKRAIDAALKHSCALCDIDVRHCGLRKSPRNCKDCNLFILGYEQSEKDLINRIRKQVETWMPEKDGEEHTEGERLAFRSVLHLLEELEDEK